MMAPTSPREASDLLLRDPNMNEAHSLKRKVLVANPNGLHMRPSAAFVELAGRFQSDVTVRYEDKRVNGKSLWDLLLLAAMPGSELIIEAVGPDASEALDELSALLGQVPTDY